MTALAFPTVILERVDLAPLDERVLVLNRSPEPDGVDVPADAVIAFTLLGGGINYAKVKVWVDGRLAHSRGQAEPPYAGGRAGVQSESGGVRVTLDPIERLRSQDVVEVRIEVPLTGVPTSTTTYTFRVADLTAPQLVAAEALSANRVAFSFDEPVELDGFGGSFEALDTPAVPLTIVDALGSGSRVEATVSPSMTPDVRYRVSLRGVRDTSGNPILAPANSAVFVGYRPPRPAARRFDLWSMLPRYNRREDTTGDLRKLIACFQEVLDLVLFEIDRFSDIFDIERAPEEFVDLMLIDLGNPFAFVLNELEKRRLAAVLVELYRLKGTEKGIRNAVRFFLGIELGEIRTFTGSPLILGESLLGVDWELAPSREYSLYAFEVNVPFTLTTEQRMRLRVLIEWAKPCHTHLVDIIEPAPIEVLDDWIVDLSELGIASTLN